MKTLISDILAIRGKIEHNNVFWVLLLALRYLISSRSFREVFLYRVGHACRHVFLVHELLCIFQSWFGRMAIPFTVKIGPGLKLPHPYGLVIIYDAVIGARAQIFQDVTVGVNFGKALDGRRSPIIGDDVVICSGAKVLGPVTVGNKVIIGANSVVLKDVPNNTIVAGVPAKKVGTFNF